MRKRESYFDSYGFDSAGPANGNEHHEDKTVTTINDDIISFIETNRSKLWFGDYLDTTGGMPDDKPCGERSR